MLWGSEIFIQTKSECDKIQTITNNALRQALRIYNQSNAVIPMLIELATPLIWLQIVRRKQMMLNRWLMLENSPITDLMQHLQDKRLAQSCSPIHKMVKTVQKMNIKQGENEKKLIYDKPFTFKNENPREAYLYYNYYMYEALEKAMDKTKANKHYMKIKTADAAVKIEINTKLYDEIQTVQMDPALPPYDIPVQGILSFYKTKQGSVKFTPKYLNSFCQSSTTYLHLPNVFTEPDEKGDVISIISENDSTIVEATKQFHKIEWELQDNPIIDTNAGTNNEPTAKYLDAETYAKQHQLLPDKFWEYQIQKKSLECDKTPKLIPNPQSEKDKRTNYTRITKYKNKKKKAVEHTTYFEIPFAVSRLIFQLRTRCLPMASQLVEYGYLPSKYKHKCPCCQEAVPETMEHFIFHCTALNKNTRTHLPFAPCTENLTLLLSDTMLTSKLDGNEQPVLFMLYDRLVERQKTLRSMPEYKFAHNYKPRASPETPHVYTTHNITHLITNNTNSTMGTHNG